jgi:hypothetical protein
MALTKKPAVWGGGPRVEIECVAASNCPENKAPAIDIQDRRTLWLERRYRLAPAMAATVAALCFVGARP